MTQQKSFKRRVRARMEKTGERYAAARRQLLRDTEPEPAATPEPAPTPEIATTVPAAEGPKPTRMPDAAVKNATGRTNDEWFALIDAWGGTSHTHTEIARWLSGEQGMPGWWAQGVTVAYEQARGMRLPGQRREGGFEITASKTVAVGVERLYEACADPTLFERWVPDGAFDISTARPGKILRGAWNGGPSRVIMDFTAKGEHKSTVALAHVKLPDAETAAQMKAFWRERLGALKELLEAER